MPSIDFKNRRILIDMMTLHCHETTRNKINFMYLIIQCKNISCNKFSFFKKKQKYFDDEKDGSTVDSRIHLPCTLKYLL